MKNLRLCYIGPAASVSLRRWVEWFAARGHDITVVTVEPAEPALASTFRQVDLGRYRGPRKFSRLIAAARMACTVSRLHPDVVHVHYLRGLAWGLLLKRTGPCVVTPWGSDILEEQGAFKEWYSRGLTQRLLKQADLVTVHSAYMERRLKSLADLRGPVSCIGWGVDVTSFRPGLDVEPLRRRWHISPDQRVILSPRLARPFYRHDLVIQALPAVAEKVASAVLMIAEHGADLNYVQSLKKLAAQLGIGDRVRFVGSLAYEEMPRWYNLADAVVMAPRSDGMPNSLLEAMACGSVPVLTRLEQYTELVQDGRNGFLVGPDGSDLAQALVKVLQDTELRRNIGAANRALMLEHGDQNQEMAKMERWYRTLTTAGSVHEPKVSLGTCAR